MNEIAFFCMDLEAYNQKSLANIFLKEYQRRTGCFRSLEDKQLFTYYKCLKANVRAKVHALSAAQSHDDESFHQHVAALRTYLRLIKKYTNTNTA